MESNAQTRWSRARPEAILPAAKRRFQRSPLSVAQNSVPTFLELHGVYWRLRRAGTQQPPAVVMCRGPGSPICLCSLLAVLKHLARSMPSLKSMRGLMRCVTTHRVVRRRLANGWRQMSRDSASYGSNAVPIPI
jgi:hypothetical protein